MPVTETSTPVDLGFKMKTKIILKIIEIIGKKFVKPINYKILDTNENLFATNMMIKGLIFFI